MADEMRPVVLALDLSPHSEFAFDCKYMFVVNVYTSV